MMAVLIGSFAIGQVGPAMSAVASACAAAYKIFSLIDRKPPIDIESKEGAKPDPKEMKGSVEFRNVTFAYPSRPTEPVLVNFSLKIEGGTTVALVGSSGCGKSTLLQLLQRFYDPQEGSVLVDGIDIKEWNLSHLRDRIGVVAQEPLLFSTTVATNISYGKPVSEGPATQQEIEEACKAASAYDFITRLPQGFDTTTGTSIASTQLSGGQRQRICIARAILRKPKLLLLDEATSALDTVSERQVQAALDRILEEDRAGVGAGGRASRSTIAIAHRLSTIRNYDRIVVLERGSGVIEDGTHAQLMALGEAGTYAKLVRMQELAHGEEPEAAAGGGGEGPRSRTASTSTATASRSRSNTGAIGTGHSIRGPASLGVPHAGDVVGAIKTVAALGPQMVPTVATAPEGEEEGDEGGADGPASPASPTANASAAAVVPATATKTAATKPVAKPSAKDDAKKWEEEKAKLPAVDKRRVWAIQYPERYYLAAGVLGSAVSGIIQPLFSLVWSDMITIFWMSNNTIYTETRRYIGYFIAIGIAQFISTVMRIGFFVYAGEKLTRRLRTMSYRAVLRQEIAFFEEERNSVGRLSSRLQADAAEVKGATGEGLSLVVQSGFAVIAGVVIAFDATWQLALVVCSIMPLMVIAALLQSKSFKGYGRGAAKALEESGHLASEATGAIKTVTAFNLQIRLLEAFDVTLETPLKSGYGKAMSAGAGNAFLGFMTFAAFSLAYYAGGSFMAQGIINFKQMMRVYLAVQMSSQAAGNAINWGPDSAKADRATRSIFQLLDRQSKIDSLSTSGEIPPPNVRAKGAVEFKNVSFAYPSRPDIPALNNVSFTIKPGQKVALVGPSGSGKSTIVQLLERFYAPTSGEILLDGKPLESYNVAWLRSQIGLISQEPVLFSDSIRYNIELGRNTAPSTALVSDEERAKRYTDLGKPKWGLGAPLEAPETYKPSEEDCSAPADVVSAAESANAAHFIGQAKYRYATHCGTRGNQQLSGGQRQRVCIARVMLRDPSVVCADEATSALVRFY
jgi:ABC-type multidrug transport system fused ATPase/permease subunit